MMKFRFKIDEKSLYFGLHNDYKRGQTATVSTPINQSKDPNKWHLDIMKLYNSGFEIATIPNELSNKCLNKTTSQANSKIVYFFEFKNLLLDGVKLECKSSFGLYVKEEIDKMIINKKGEVVQNTHFGRQKLHYPITLKYESDGFKINNENVLNTILEQNGGFAFILREMECDTKQKSLNFITSIVGIKDTRLSQVFKKQKGVGKKLIVDDNIADIQEYIDDNIENVVDDYHNVVRNIDFEQINNSKMQNGKLGEQYVYEHIAELLKCKVESIYHTSLDFPTAPYDIEYIENGIKKYLEVKSTASKKEIFNMSSGEIKFMKRYKENYILILVTEVNSNYPKTRTFSCEQVLGLRQEFPITRFFA